MNCFNIERAFDTKRVRKWDKVYIAVDFHDTVFKGYYQNDQGFKFYQYAEQILRYWTKREDIVLIAYTCSHTADFERVNKWMNERGINFDYLNENPECENTELAAFHQKPYFNILLDDKAGEDFEDAWIIIIKMFEEATGESVMRWAVSDKEFLNNAVHRRIVKMTELLIIP
jgi:hypothetical protein